MSVRWLGFGLLLVVALGAVLSGGCSSRQQGGTDTLTVFVSIPPQEYFVKRIAGERARVRTLVAGGQSPHTYAPNPAQLAALSSARLYFRIGIEFENALLPKVKGIAPALKIVDTRAGIRLREMGADELQVSCEVEHAAHDGHDHAAHDEEAEADGHAEEHGHHDHAGASDPHIWLDPGLVKVQAQTILRALIEVDSAGASTYRENHAAFLADLDSLDATLRQVLAPVKGKELFVYHPAFGYFAEAYGLRQVAVECGGKEPSARQLSRLIGLARQHGVRVIFVQPGFSQKSALSLAQQIGGAVVTIDAMPREYLTSMREMARQVGEGLRR